MSAFHVVVRPVTDPGSPAALAPLYGLFDFMVDGVNVTARITDAMALSLLGDLAQVVAALSTARAPRGTIQLYAEEDVWELGLERDGDELRVAVYRTGPLPEVAVHGRRVALAAFRSGLIAALADAPTAGVAESTRAALRAGRAALEKSWPPVHRPRVEPLRAEIAPRTRGQLSFAGGVELRRAPRARDTGLRKTVVERADLHSLLCRGDLQVVARDRTLTLTDCYPVLVAERLVALAGEVLDAWQGGRALFRRVPIGEHRLGVRRGPGDGALEVSVARAAATAADGRAMTFPAVEAVDFARAVTTYSARLIELLTESDPSLEHNLRLKSVHHAVDALLCRVEESETDDSIRNPEPEAYRPFAGPQPRAPGASGRWSEGGAMRFVPRWVATVPAVDLASTFLCGDRLVVGAARETACLDRVTGQVLWRAPTGRGGTVIAPNGVVRIEPDGKLAMRDLETGELRFSTKLAPRAAGGATGAVVHGAGLPRLLVVAEGDRRITALDLVTGEVRWRYTGPRPAAYRMRRSGKLLLVTGGDSALFALDAATGEVVWRVRDRSPFAHAFCLDHDSVYVTSGAPGGRHRLHHVDLWTGDLRWTAALDEAPVPGQPALIAGQVVAVPVRDSSGSGVAAFRIEDGAPLWSQAPGLLAPLAAWIALDDAFVANGGSGVLHCLEAATGATRYSHVFSGAADADQPRRLEPILRNGALFVPQHQVSVLRPGDGELIGAVPSDLIPDLLRVDEECAVYLAEESGHLAAFSAAARLTLVR